MRTGMKTEMKKVKGTSNSRSTGVTLEPTIVGRGADAELAAVTNALRRSLAETYGTDSPLKRLLTDGAAQSYYLQQRLANWTATLVNIVDRDLFGHADGDTLSMNIAEIAGVYLGFSLDRVAQQLQLQERAAKMLGGYLAALQQADDQTAARSRPGDGSLDAERAQQRSKRPVSGSAMPM